MDHPQSFDEPTTAMSTHTFTEKRFSELDLEPVLLDGVDEAGFRFCTPIQALALPIALAGRDVEGQAQTGTGKTAAFLLAAMNTVLRGAPRSTHNPAVLVVAPTRELAVQIYRDAEVLGKYSGLRIGAVYGGIGYDEQRSMLRDGLDLLIGTPGRLIDYFKQGVFNLKHIQVAVVDEADRMFDLGFIKDLRYLLRRMPAAEKRLSMLFSATLSLRVSELAYEHMNVPEIVRVDAGSVTVDQVTQVLYHVSSDEKLSLLVGLLRRMDVTRTMVFFNTKRSVERVARYLDGNGFESGVLTGDVPQRRRLSLLDKFSAGKLPILLVTDVAARGLHIPDVSHVFNYDLPQDGEDYVHRVGRTARVGASGDAISLSCEQYCFSLMDIESYIGRPIPTIQVTDDLLAELAPPRRRARSNESRPSRRGGHKGTGGGARRSRAR